MTTQCKYSPDDQVEFAYGEMNPKKAEAFRAHLESCPACREAVSELTRAAELAEKVRRAPVPEAIGPPRAIRQDQRGGRSFSGW